MLDLMKCDRLAALRTMHHGLKRVAARRMAPNDAMTARPGSPGLGPMAHRHQHGRERAAHLGEAIIVARRVRLIGLARQDAAINQMRTTVGDTGAAAPQSTIKFVKSTDAAEAIAQDQHGPAIPDDRHRAGDRAFLAFEFLPAHRVFELLGKGLTASCNDAYEISLTAPATVARVGSVFELT